ncbi:MAG: DMT family transporter [Bryobacteraceae bacterium]
MLDARLHLWWVNWLIYLAAIAAGAANPGQAGTNAELRKSIGQPIFAAAWVYLSGLMGVLFVQLIFREGWPGGQKLAAAPWWAWTGGLISIASTVAGLMLAQRLGSGVFTGISITASLAMSILLDHFGWIGFKVHPASWPRILGCCLMVFGLWLVSEF